VKIIVNPVYFMELFYVTDNDLMFFTVVIQKQSDGVLDLDSGSPNVMVLCYWMLDEFK
jgi:hypothetical protein